MQNHFFIRGKKFYHVLSGMIVGIAFQNLIAYSVNMLDNIMLGSYSQTALSGAATVNQIFFIVQQIGMAIGNALVVLASQYWGQKNGEAVRRLTWIAGRVTAIAGCIIFLICTCVPEQLIGVFTGSDELILEGTVYLKILKWSFVLFLFSNLMISMLRSIEVIKISVLISCVSLIVNGGINYLLIFGNCGFPELGIRGAAIGTLIARTAEMLIVFFYVALMDKKVRLFSEINKNKNKTWMRILQKDYRKVFIPILATSLLWAISVPMQTAILGHLSDDAIAANSVSSTFFQYMKVIIVAISSASSVVIGKEIGNGNTERVKAAGRTLSVIDVGIGVFLAVVLIILKNPLLSMYRMSETAAVLADHLIVLMSLVMIGMSYQMPVHVGILQGAGDTRFCMWMNMISTWGIVMPLSFMAAFVWKLPVELVVFIIQSDQFFKGIPVFMRFRSYKWIHKLTKKECV